MAYGKNLLAAGHLTGLGYLLHTLDSQGLLPACGGWTRFRSRAFDLNFMADVLAQLRGVAGELIGSPGLVG